jgi:hypothetical protein
MTQDEMIEMARESGLETQDGFSESVFYFAKLIAEREREVLEKELLKLKQGVAANSDYVQGRWDLIGEFQDVIRARGNQ